MPGDTLGRMKKTGVTRWGIVGTGRVVSDSVAPGICKSPGSSLAAVAGRNRDAASAIAREFGPARVYASPEELVADPDVDVVYVATANAFHKGPVLAAARAGKHVLCEKPLALSVADAREMVDACERAGVIFRAAFQIRLEKMLHRVRDIVASGELGPLRLVTFERSARIDQPGAWRSDPAQGGILYDVATHLLDLIPWITALRYEEFVAFSHPDRREGLSDDTIAILARMSGGCSAIVRASRELPYAKNDLIVEGTQGVLTTSGVRWLDEYWIEVETEAGKRTERFVPTAIYHAEVEAMERELAGERSVLPDGAEAIHMIEVANAIYESIRSRRAVSI